MLVANLENVEIAFAAWSAVQRARRAERSMRRLRGSTDLSKRDRSLITVAMLAALYRTDEMRGHMQRALDNGVTETELKGLITHVAFYAGWPCAVNAGRVAIEVFGPK